MIVLLLALILIALVLPGFLTLVIDVLLSTIIWIVGLGFTFGLLALACTL